MLGKRPCKIFRARVLGLSMNDFNMKAELEKLGVPSQLVAEVVGLSKKRSRGGGDLSDDASNKSESPPLSPVWSNSSPSTSPRTLMREKAAVAKEVVSAAKDALSAAPVNAVSTAKRVGSAGAGVIGGMKNTVTGVANSIGLKVGNGATLGWSRENAGESGEFIDREFALRATTALDTQADAGGTEL